MHSSRKIPVAVPFTEGGNLSEPYIKSTDEYVTETAVTYLLESENLRLEGHPYKGLDKQVPFVNPSRFTVTELALPDMNKFYLPPLQGNLSLNTEIFVWKLVGVRVDSQGPLQPATTGQTYTQSQPNDAGLANPNTAEKSDQEEDPAGTPNSDYGPSIIHHPLHGTIYDNEGANMATTATTYNWGIEHKQIQLLAVGCKPLLGVYEALAKGGVQDTDKGDIVRMTKDIGDGDMHEFGFGNIDYKTTSYDKTLLPVEMCYNNGPTLIPDKLGMQADLTGDRCFFMWERTAAGIRHTRHTNGLDFTNNPSDNTDVFAKCQNMVQQQNAVTAGMVSSTLDLFNKNYWLNKAQGPNNGVIWHNKLYVTHVDNTRGYIHMITEKGTDSSNYDPTKVNCFLRHIREYKVSVLVRLCKVKLEAQLIQYLLQFNKEFMKNLGFQFNPLMKSVSTFRDLTRAEEEVVEDPEDMPLKVVSVDCSGQAQLKNSEQSHHPLARSYHAAIGSGSAPKRGRSTQGVRASNKRAKRS